MFREFESRHGDVIQLLFDFSFLKEKMKRIRNRAIIIWGICVEILKIFRNTYWVGHISGSYTPLIW